MNSVWEALTSEVEISKSVCWTDSKAAWYWIIQSDKDWKQFVQHRVDEIRRLVPVECWNHCPGVDNPADILSRGIDPRSLEANALWWNGPAWLTSCGRPEIQSEFSDELLPEECLTEMKAKDLKAVLTGDTALTVNVESVSLSDIIHCGEFSSLERVLRVTALVLKFVRILKAKRNGSRRAKHLSIILDHFWKRWRAEYLLELRNSHSRVRRATGSSLVAVGDLVLVHDESHKRCHWKMGVVEQTLTSRDGQVRGAEVRVQGKGKRTGLLKRPLNLLYPLEINCVVNSTNGQEKEPGSQGPEPQAQVASSRPRRRAAAEGERLRREWIAELNAEH